MQSAFLPILAAVLIFVALKAHSHRMLGLLRRTRWILVSLLVIYAFLTPGDAVWSLPFPSPTREGLQDGLMQLSRLLCVLAGLSILLTSLSQERLISGLYIFSYPLRYIGVSSERIAVRLALTLRYAERAMQETAKDWRSSIEHALIPENEHEAIFELPVQMPSLIDVLILIIISVVFFGLWR
jgi:energy-coupling factor transport system permease protein